MVGEEGKEQKTIIWSHFLKKEIVTNKLGICKCGYRYMLRIE